MKRLAVFSGVMFLLIFIQGCNYSTNVEAEKSETANEIAVAKTPADSRTKQNTDVSKSVSKSPRVWVGLVYSDDGNINSSDVVWSGGDDTPSDIPESEGGIKIGTEYDVDIMNCGGYLGSGKIAFVEEGGFPPNWRLKFTPETITTDGVEKIQQCDADQKDGLIDSSAFAVTPRNEDRKTIKIGKVDTKKLFASLSKDTQKWLNNKYGSDIREKNNLSLKNDNWTDIDGDGKIDLVFAFTNYDEEHSSGAIMLLVNGEWKDIGDVRD